MPLESMLSQPTQFPKTKIKIFLSLYNGQMHNKYVHECTCQLSVVIAFK